MNTTRRQQRRSSPRLARAGFAASFAVVMRAVFHYIAMKH